MILLGSGSEGLLDLSEAGVCLDAEESVVIGGHDFRISISRALVQGGTQGLSRFYRNSAGSAPVVSSRSLGWSRICRPLAPPLI